VISRNASLLLLLALTVLVALTAVLLPPIPQPQSYHLFADQRSLLGIPHFADVISNFPFAVVGTCGLIFLFRRHAGETPRFIDPRERWPYLLVFVGVFLTAFGSSYYHWSPSNARLVWDRLPMTIAFMSMVAAVIAERISLRLGLWLLPILLLLGLGSVLQWYVSETRGEGDLRFYAVVQVYSALVLLLALLFTPSYTRGSDLAVVVGFYALAKVLEALDRPIFSLGQIVSGHTMKHLAAATAAYCIVRMLQKRRPVSPSAGGSLSSPQL
jgi:hypothetical protein